MEVPRLDIKLSKNDIGKANKQQSRRYSKKKGCLSAFPGGLRHGRGNNKNPSGSWTTEMKWIQHWENLHLHLTQIWKRSKPSPQQTVLITTKRWLTQMRDPGADRFSEPDMTRFATEELLSHTSNATKDHRNRAHPRWWNEHLTCRKKTKCNTNGRRKVLGNQL